MSVVIKHSVVLHWFESLNNYPERYPPLARIGEPQIFTTEETPPYSPPPGTGLRLDYDAWQEMGGPTVITVTVEPGDRLNDEAGA